MSPRAPWKPSFGFLLIAALAALLLLPGAESVAWLIVLLIVMVSATLLVTGVRARRAARGTRLTAVGTESLRKFSEVRHASPWLGAAVVAVGVAVAAHLVVSTWSVATSGGERALFVTLSVAVVALCVAVARMSSVTQVGPDGIELAFRCGITVWRRRIPWSDVAVDGVERAGVTRSGGLGLRHQGGGRTVLMVRPGAGVVLRTQDGRRTYVIGSDRPRELLDAVTARRRG